MSLNSRSRTNRDRRDQAFCRAVIAEATKRHREPSCTLNHEVQRRELRDKKMQSRACPSCGWVLSPAREEPEPERCYWCDGLLNGDDKYSPYCCRTCSVEAERDNYLD